MKTRLFVYTTFILLAGLLCFFVASVFITHTNNIKLAESSVEETTRICVELYDEKIDDAAFVNTGGTMRITIIAQDGTVIADSLHLDISTLGNHLDRPEVQAALNGAPQAFIRYSNTTGTNMIYYALKADSASGFVIIRVAIPVTSVDVFMYQSLPLLIVLFLAIILLGLVVIRGIVGRVIKPLENVEQKLRQLSEGEYHLDPIPDSYEEINDITKKIDGIAQVLQNNITSINGEKDKLDYILNNIGDGLSVVDENRSIVLVNSIALEIFGAMPDIKSRDLNYLFFDKTLNDAVNSCIDSGKSSLFELTYNGRVFSVAVKRLPNTRLTMLVLSDITDSKENARRREEFFANASHELKTPLTTIKGFSELASINNKDDSITVYIDNITRETDRMMSLIADMLKLSELENSKDIKQVFVSVADVTREVREMLSTDIEAKAINFVIAGDTVVSAEKDHVYELVKNLIENAVRYNDQGGSVSVVIKNDESGSSMLVSDNGIGIPPEEQAWVFERFHRVEKSRSQRNGGTGLGLSIVKHICTLYGWKVSLESKLGIGTEVTVVFREKE